MQSITEKQKKSYEVLKDKLGLKNHMAMPRIAKVVVSVGTGKHTRTDKKKNEFVEARLAKITGQKPVARSAKISIASFKLREGEVIGYSVTLRKKRMNDFLDRFLNIAIPRIRDFRGFDPKAVDEMGNLTFGIKEHNVFPETADEELKDVFGLAVTIVTTAKNKKDALAYFEAIGIPFKK